MTNVWRGVSIAAWLAIMTPLLALAQDVVIPPRESVNDPLPRILMETASPESLRVHLAGYADAVQAENPREAGRAWALIARSHQRAARIDDAIAAYRRGLAIHPDDGHHLALVDLLLRRRGEADVTEALRLSTPGGLGHNPRGLTYEIQARHAWARFLAGEADSALIELEPLGRWLLDDTTWRFRIGQVEVAGGKVREAFKVLLPLAVASRGQDGQVNDLLDTIGESTGITSQLDQEVNRKIAESMRDRAAPLPDLGARSLRFWGRDSFPLGGAITTPAGKGPFRAAVILVGPGERYGDWDSLTVLLRERGFAVMMLDARGSGESVSTTCPLPDTWVGREDQLERLVARDVRQAYDELAGRAEIDSPTYLVAANHGMAAVSALAAESDRRIGALMLVSPRPEEVERGPLRARLERLHLPVYFQIGPEDDIRLRPVIEELYHATDRGASWVSDGHMAGTGPAQFRNDAEVAKHVKLWLDRTFPPSGQSASPRRTRREG